MDLWTALRVYAARWYVAVPVLFLSFYAAYAVGQTIDPTYETAGSILLVPPLDQPPAEFQSEYEPIVNPCLRPGNGPRSCADAVSRILLSEGELRRFELAGLSPDYDISIPRDSLIIDFTVAGESVVQVNETLDELIRRTNAELLGIQQTQNTPANQIISVEPLFISPEPEEFSGGRLRVIGALVLVGVVASASIAFLVDSLAGRRGGVSNRRAIRTEPTAPPSASRAMAQPTGNRRIVMVEDDDDESWDDGQTLSADSDELSSETTTARRRVRRRRSDPEGDAAQKSPAADTGKLTPASTANKPTANKPTANKPTANKPTANKPTANKPTANKPTANKPTANKPTTTSGSTADKSAGAGRPGSEPSSDPKKS